MKNYEEDPNKTIRRAGSSREFSRIVPIFPGVLEINLEFYRPSHRLESQLAGVNFNTDSASAESIIKSMESIYRSRVRIRRRLGYGDV